MVDVFLTCDDYQKQHVSLRCQIMTTEGVLLEEFNQNLSTYDVLKTEKVKTIECKKYVKEYSERDLLLFLEVKNKEGILLSEALITFVKPKHLSLKKAIISYQLKNNYVILLSDKPALWTFCDTPGIKTHFDENFIMLKPNLKKEIYYQSEKKISKSDIVVRSIKSLSDEN